MLDKWFNRDNPERFAKYENSKRWLAEEEKALKTLIEEEQYWEAFNRLNYIFLCCSQELENGDYRDGTRNTPYVMHALIEWTSSNKKLIDSIIRGIGGDGYGISTSIYGMNFSVSFSTGVDATIASNISVNSNPPVRNSTGSGINRAVTHRVRAPSPNSSRSDTKNPNNPAFRATAVNRSNQLNPNSSIYRSSRGEGKSKK